MRRFSLIVFSAILLAALSGRNLSAQVNIQASATNRTVTEKNSQKAKRSSKEITLYIFARNGNFLFKTSTPFTDSITSTSKPEVSLMPESGPQAEWQHRSLSQQQLEAIIKKIKSTRKFRKDGSCLILLQQSDKAPVVARFADPVNDPPSIGEQTKAELVSDSYIYNALLKSGASNRIFRGLVCGSLYLKCDSSYGGPLDFASNGKHNIQPDILYITTTRCEGHIAHNNYNFGNFLWGAASKAAGVPRLIAQLGSHLNNFFLSPDTRWTLDSKDDQFSIRTGSHWMRQQ